MAYNSTRSRICPAPDRHVEVAAEALLRDIGDLLQETLAGDIDLVGRLDLLRALREEAQDTGGEPDSRADGPAQRTTMPDRSGICAIYGWACRLACW